MELTEVTWEDEVEVIAEFVQEDGCHWHSTCGGDDECPFEDCLLLSDDWKELLGKYCLERIGEGDYIIQIAVKLGCSVRSVYRYMGEARSASL